MPVIVYSVFRCQSYLLPARCVLCFCASITCFPPDVFSSLKIFKQVSGEMTSISCFQHYFLPYKAAEVQEESEEAVPSLPALIVHPQPASVRTGLTAFVLSSLALPSASFFHAVPTTSLPVPFPSRVLAVPLLFFLSSSLKSNPHLFSSVSCVKCLKAVISC